MGRVATRREFMCTRCGQKVSRAINSGRPDPGRCSKSKTKGPHSWVKNRDI